MGEFSKDDRLELIYEDGKPSYFKEKPPGTDALSIGEATAGYLQEARPRGAIGYSSGDSTLTLASPNAALPGNYSVFSPRASGTGSVATTPETSAPPNLALSSLEAVTQDNPMIALSSRESLGSNEIRYGKRLIPQIIDSLAASEPDRIVFSLATLSDNSFKLKVISAYVFNKAIDKTAWWLSSLVGKPNSIQPVGYIGPRKFLLKKKTVHP
jgi:hypothetical protein